MPKDRFRGKKTREKQSDAIIDSDWDRQSVGEFDRGTKAQQYAVLVEELMKHPNFYPAPWVDDLLRQLKGGNFNKLLFLKWRTLDRACHRTLIGPIQRKVKPTSEATKRWRANLASFEAMSQARPLKPPSRSGIP